MMPAHPAVQVRDIWQQKELSTVTGAGSVPLDTVDAFDSRFFVLSPAEAVPAAVENA